MDETVPHTNVLTHKHSDEKHILHMFYVVSFNSQYMPIHRVVLMQYQLCLCLYVKNKYQLLLPLIFQDECCLLLLQTLALSIYQVQYHRFIKTHCNII